MKLFYPITDAALHWLEVIFAERFGYAWSLSHTSDGLRMRLAGAGGAILFDQLCNSFTYGGSERTCAWWNASNEGWKSVLCGALPAPLVSVLPSPLIEKRLDEYIIHFDILGLIYWMLARLEEIGRTDLDQHERFPAISSHAYKHGYLDRPVVDEWLDVLGQVIQRQWPGIELKQHYPRTVVSCDLDSPFLSGGSWKGVIRTAGGDIIKRKSPKKAMKTIVGKWYSVKGDYRFDTHHAGTEFIMETNERAGRSVGFYFIPERTASILDGQQPGLHDVRIRKLMYEIHIRGHEIGIHPGYYTYAHPEIMAKSVNSLRESLNVAGIKQTRIGGRQHYLRWETPTTARLLDLNGLHYDSTLSYADYPGFRCGTCFEYPMFDPVEQRALKLRQRPLIVMECSVIAERYLGLGYSDEALELMLRYQKTCYNVGGQFTLLWHNSHFENDEDMRFYHAIINA